MVTIEYTEELLENEPGPNFYWRGTPSDFLQLIIDLHRLGREDGIEINLDGIDYIKILGTHSIKTKSSVSGNILCKVSGKEIIIDLRSSIWRRVFDIFLRISFYPSHDYIEFDDLDFIEDANFIASSEAAEEKLSKVGNEPND